MKNIYAFIFCIISVISLSAGCPTGDITLSTQAQIDAFPTNYPGCTDMPFNLTIQESAFGNISNLNGLSQIITIEGNLAIKNNAALTSLAGLSAVTYIGLDLYIFSDLSITSLTGLGPITFIGSVDIINCPALTNLTGLGPSPSIGSLVIDNNNSMTSLTGLEAVTSIGGGIHISSNPALINLMGLGAVTSIGGNIDILNNAVLTSLVGLGSLTSTNTGQDVNIVNNPALTSLMGLGSLTSLGGGLLIKDNATLTSLAALSGITNIGGYLNIQNNPVLMGLSGLGALTSIQGDALYIHNNPALMSLTGLDALTSVNGYIDIGSNASLASITAFSAVTSINGALVIQNNAALTSLSGLDNINYSGITNLTIQSSNLLSACAVQSICSYLAIPSNPATITGNATGCATRPQVETACLALPIELVSFTGKSRENETVLRWQTAFEKNNDYFQVEYGQDGGIYQSIGQVKSGGNSNTPQTYTFTHLTPSSGTNYYRLKQVNLDGTYAYSTVIIINRVNNEISLFPNPTRGDVEIRGKTFGEGTIRLTDHFGRLIKLQQSSEHRMDIGDLADGIYFIEISTDSQSIVKRIVKE